MKDADGLRLPDASGRQVGTFLRQSLLISLLSTASHAAHQASCTSYFFHTSSPHSVIPPGVARLATICSIESGCSAVILPAATNVAATSLRATSDGRPFAFDQATLVPINC